MAKYVHPNMIIDSSAAFLKNVTFDSSVYFQGVTHINAPAAVSSQTPFALVLESGSGTDLQVKSVQLGTMAKENATSWDASLSAIRTDIGNLETSVGALDTLTQSHTTQLGIHNASIGVLTSLTAVHDSSLGFLNAYRLIQDASIAANWQRWIDSNRSGFVDRSQTTLSFTDTTGTVTLNDAGSGWSYYRDGIKYTISGNKSVALPDGGSAVAGVYYITIEGTDGALTVDTAVWDLNDPNVLPVSIIIWNASNSPKYWMADERHTMLIDRKMHQYLHTTQGTKLVAGGTLDGPDVSVNTNAANAIGWETTTIADEDIFLNIAALARPDGASNNYVVFYRTDANTWSWKQENTPLSEGGSFIEWDNAGTLTTGQTGKYYTSYVGFTDLNDAARVIIIPGRGEYDTLDAARDEDVTTFDFTTLPAREFVLAWKLVWRADTAYTTYGKVVAAAEPIRVQVNVTTSSGATTESHNDLLGLQGGTSTERYHLSAAQYNDYIGESEVLTLINDVSTRLDTRLDNHDSSIAALDVLTQNLESSVGALVVLTQTHTTDINNLESSVGDLDLLTQDHTADIAQLDASIVRIDAYQAIQDASIAAVGGAWKPYVDGSLATRDSSIIALFAKNAAQDASIIRIDASLNDTVELFDVIDASLQELWNYNAIQDASIALAISGTTSAWNGLTRTDNSIGLGGTLSQNTVINSSDYDFIIGGGDLDTQEGSYGGIGIFNSAISIRAGDANNLAELAVGSDGTLSINFSGGAIITDEASTGGLVYSDDYSATFQPNSLITKAFAESLVQSATVNVANGLQTLTDGSIGLGGALLQDTSIATDAGKFWIGNGDMEWPIINPSGTNFTTFGVGSNRLFLWNKTSTAEAYVNIQNGEATISGTSSVVMGSNNYAEISTVNYGRFWISQYGMIIDDYSTNTQGLIYGGDYESDFIARSLVTKQYVDGQKGAGNGLKILSDGSIGLGGTLSEPTTITANSTNTLSLTGLVTSVDNTPFALVQESAGGPIRTRELGSMAWATTTDYTLKSLFDSSITAIWTKFGYVDTSLGILNNWNVSQDASIVTLRNTTLSALQTANNGLTANDTSVALGGALTHDTDIDATGYTFSVTGGLSVYGTLTVDGSVTYVNSVDLNVSDNIITVNYGETGAGVSKGFAGLKVDRGTEDDYVFVFAEATDTFRIGIANESGLPTGTQAVATREDTPEGFGIPFWNGSLYRFDTSSGFEFTPGVGLSLPIATNDPAEATALMITPAGLVVSRELGTMAFATATDYTLKTLFDSSVAAIWTKFGSVDTSIAGLDTLTQTHTTNINNLESSVGALDLLTQNHTQSIADLSTGKLDAVATVTGIDGGHEVFSNEADNIAYIKKIVAGTGATITSDASTITIAVSGAAGYVSKYAGTFDGTAGTSLSITAATHGLGIGPLQVTVYDGTDQVWVDVNCAANGDITLKWTGGSLSASCKYIIVG